MLIANTLKLYCRLGLWLSVLAPSSLIAVTSAEEAPLSANLIVVLEPIKIECAGASTEIPVRGLQADLALSLEWAAGIAVSEIEGHVPGLNAEGLPVKSIRPADNGIKVSADLECIEGDRVNYDVVATRFSDGKEVSRATGTAGIGLAAIRDALLDAVFRVVGKVGAVDAADRASSATLNLYLTGIDASPVDIGLLLQATERDGDFAPAWIRLGEGELRLGEEGGVAATAHYQAAERALNRALSVRPGQPRAVHALASVYMRTGRTAQAIRLLVDGIGMRPDSAKLHAKLGYALRYAGLFQRSIAEYRLAQRLDGAYSEWIQFERQIIKSHIYSGNYEKAAESYQRVLAWLQLLGREPDEKLLFYRGVAKYYAGDEEEAVAFFDASVARDDTSLWSAFAEAYRAAVLGETSRLVELADALESGNVSDGERRYRLTHLNSLAHRTDKALEHLEKAAISGFFSYPYTKSDSLLANIRDTAEFHRVLAEIEKLHAAVSRQFR